MPLTKLFEKKDSDNQFHNKNKPASVVIDFSGRIVTCFYKHGVIHRVGGPAIIVQNRSKGCTIRRYIQDGVLRRENDLHTTECVYQSVTEGIIRTTFNFLGAKEGDHIRILQWKCGNPTYGLLHRISGPAKKYYVNGILIHEKHCLNGLLHNPVGPSVCNRVISNPYFMYYLHGRRLQKDIFVERLEKRLEVDNQ